MTLLDLNHQDYDAEAVVDDYDNDLWDDDDRAYERLTDSPWAACVDPDGHDRLYRQRETTWRLTDAQRAAEADGGCGWCGGRRKT